ncbi:MAG: tetratricopeptide repeat protein, partial [Planctomycetes bacterium]|nr:tetratricopeptide repeat protein [Planctomycetota bacterium]
DDGHAPLAQFGIAQALAAKGDSAGAVAAWNAFLARWPKHAEAPKAQFSVAQTLLAQNRFEDATTAATQFLAAYPSDPLWTQAQGLLVEAAWQRGVLALTEKDYDKAHALWSAFIDQFPLSPRATQAQFALGEVRAAQGRWADAIADWRKAAAKFPQEAAAPEVLLKAARATEEKLVRMDEALAGYEAIAKQYGGASAGREAGLRAAQMKEKFLLLRVERSYTTAETAKLHLETRNVERIELRAYRLDLLEYFRKKSTIANFEQIAVDVVKPDKTWEEPIREYERLKLISKEVDLPLSGEGAWILVAREKDYTATTLVLISDLSVVTKEAPQQLLVFAKDEVKGAPAEGVNVLVSDGSSIVGEGRTGKDGTWSKEFERPRGSARIFVWRGASYASNESALTNLAVWGYQTKVYLYTDRPVYRPNQIVHVKGIVRRVKGGYYDVSAGEKLKLSVRDPNGLVLVEKELTTNDFGTVAEDCFLGDAPALGTYAVAAMLGDSPYAGEFKVEEYRKPEFLVDVRPEREAYALGETVKAKIKVTYVFGGAVPDAELRVRAMKSPYKFDTTRYADYAWYYQAMAKEEEEARRKKAPQGEEGEVAETILETTVRTDRNGEAEVSVPTGHVDRNVTIGIAVLARDVTNRWVSGYASVPMTARSFWSVVKTEKKLYQPKETLTATLITVNAAETPVPTEGKLIVVRRRQASGQVVEDAVQEAPASTDEGGRGEVKLVIDKPGDYVLRYVGTDRARKQAGEEGSAAITVEGAAEDLAKQARIVADRQEYKRGEKARVVVSSPIEGVWALLTYEGERVFEHQVLFLKDRATTLSVEMKDEFAPNVFLSIAIPHKNTLYKDTDEVRVFKFATLAVAARPGEVKPGSAVTFDVAATDQNGRPVEAEFSLGLVDEAVYAVESERAPHILSHFYAGARRNAVVTRTSYEFKHAAQTKTVSADLKKEMERRVTEATAAIAAGERALAEEGRELYALEELAKAEKGSSLGDAIGIGGGAGGGGRYGGSFGGRVNRRSKGGGTKNGDDAGGADEPAPADKANAPASAPRPGTPTGGLRKQAESLRRRGEAKLKQGDLDAAKADFSEALEGESGEYEKTIEDVQKALELDSKDGKPRGWGKMPGNVNAASQEQLGEVAGKYYKRTSLTAWIAPVLRRNFADTAFWVAQARTDANGKATITVTLPDNLTTWKATARCVTRDTLVGSGTARVTAKKDLLVRVDAPRFLTQHDEIDLAAFVHNNLAAAKDVKTEVTANGLALAPAPGAGPGAAAAAAAAADAQLTLVGPELKGIEPRALGAWSRRVLAAAAGKARVQAKAQTDAESDALELEIPILPHGLAVVATERGQVVDRALVDFLVPGEGVVPGTEKVEIRAVPSVALSLLDAISYLQEYPYGC